jgi:2-methylfumaryl-CoA isomerase
MYQLLKGLRVVEGSAFIAAPLGGMTLAQLGAEVIRFDPIGGGLDYHRWPKTAEGQSLYWAGLNKGKRSIAVDLASEEGRELVISLATAPGADAGIFLTNFPTNTWLAFERLCERRSDLIMVNVQGNSDGSSALDYTINCATGIPYATGDGGSEGPVNHMFPAWDCITGINAALAVLAAERHRRSTGEGQLVKLSLADIAFSMLGNLGNIAEVEVNDSDRAALGNRIFGAFGKDFGTGDGRRIMLVAVTNRQWRGLVRATGMEATFKALAERLGLDLEEEGDRYAATDEIADLIQSWCGERSLQDIGECFDQHGVCWGPYQSFREAIETDPRCSTDNPMFENVFQPGIGHYRAPGSPLRFEGLDRQPVAAAPQLGADTDKVLSEVLGLPDLEIAKLHDRGVVAG